MSLVEKKWHIQKKIYIYETHRHWRLGAVALNVVFVAINVIQFERNSDERLNLSEFIVSWFEAVGLMIWALIAVIMVFFFCFTLLFVCFALQGVSQ